MPLRKREETQKVLRRKLIPIAIIAFWLIMMGLLGKQELARRSTVPMQSGGAAEASDSWMGIYAAAKDGTETRIGYMRTQSIPGNDGGDEGVEYRLTLKLAAQLLSFPTEISLNGSTWVSRENGLQRVTFNVASFNEHMMKANGYAKGGQFHIDIETAGESFPMSFPIQKNMMVSGGLGTTTLHIPSLEIGDEIRVPTFDPLTFSYNEFSTITCVGTDTFTFDGETVPVKILETDVNGIKSTSWVTLENEAVRVKTPFGFHLKKISPREALEQTELADATDFLDAVAIRPAGLTPFRGATRMVIQLSGLTQNADPPDDAIQKRLDHLKYEIAPTAEASTAALADPQSYLTGDAFVQIDHPTIQALRDGIIANIDTPYEQAQAIYEWLWQNIDKKPVLSFPSALDVAKTREGDCNEHTVLFTAIARSAGIPTRMAIGVVWSDVLGGFYYHAWPEVHIDNTWIPMDPTLGQPIADATHIKFLEGNMDTWPKLMTYLGQVNIEILEIE